MASERHYLQRTHLALMFLAFFAITVPLAVMQVSTVVAQPVQRAIMVWYLFLLGATHFVVTWALYLNGANLRHFASSAQTKITYFVAPAAIMAAFFTMGVLEVPAEGTLVAIWFLVAVSAVDYFHAVRQSFGVLQMVKGRAGGPFFPRYLSKADDAWFLSLWVLQILTFASDVRGDFDGRFSWSNVPARIVLVVAGVLFAVIVHGFVLAWRSAGTERSAVLAAFAYFLLQSASAGLVVYRSRLYFASLAMHYVEYHLLMVPRLFEGELDTSSKVDRIAAWFRRRKGVFYGAVVAVAACVSAGPLLALGGVHFTRDDRFGWFFVNLLGGIFVAHYFVEAFVWKFRQPFYRETLVPLYFTRPNRVDAAGIAR
jgi:hypothetical protein